MTSLSFIVLPGSPITEPGHPGLSGAQLPESSLEGLGFVAHDTTNVAATGDVPATGTRDDSAVGGRLGEACGQAVRSATMLVAPCQTL